MGVRTTIYVSEDLKKRMDKVKENVSWSAVACEAFERKLGEISAKKARKSMADVVQRLRASKLAEASESRKVGHEDGRAWAMNVAESGQLKRLAVSRDRSGVAWEAGWAGAGTAYSPSELFYFVIEPDDDKDRNAAEEFSGEHMSEGYECEPEYVIGFADGALEIWNEVESKL